MSESNEENLTSSKVTFKTTDGKTIEVATDVISQSQTIKHMIEDDCADGIIPLPNINSKVLSKIIEYCQKHCKSCNDEKEKDEIREWDIEFMTGMDEFMTVDVVGAANYLNIKGLLDLTAQKIANKIKDYSLKQIRELFKIEMDFTPEELANLRQEYGDVGFDKKDF